MDNINTFLFDLDGTLLPMDNDTFTKAYFTALVRRISPLGFEKKRLIDSVWGGIEAMVRNDGSRLNEAAFWTHFADVWGKEALQYLPDFDDFYQNDFLCTKSATQPTPLSGKCIAELKQKGYTLVLATNPIFPKSATAARMAWAGLRAEDFALVTTYENSSYCKPNPEYYADILRRIGKKAEECVMVGNDVQEDMCAKALGIQTILVPDCLIDRTNGSLSDYNCKSLAQLYDFFCCLPAAAK